MRNSGRPVLPILSGQRANVLVSEILGTLLLGESALEYVADTRERLLTPDAVIVPACGAQFATLIESEDLQSITSVNSWGGFDLSGFNAMQDTVSLGKQTNKQLTRYNLISSHYMFLPHVCSDCTCSFHKAVWF